MGDFLIVGLDLFFYFYCWRSGVERVDMTCSFFHYSFLYIWLDAMGLSDSRLYFFCYARGRGRKGVYVRYLYC